MDHSILLCKLSCLNYLTAFLIGLFPSEQIVARLSNDCGDALSLPMQINSNFGLRLLAANKSKNLVLTLVLDQIDDERSSSVFSLVLDQSLG